MGLNSFYNIKYMKIYINNLNLNILNELSNKFKKNLIDSETYTVLYTEEGIYQIYNKAIYSLQQVDKEIKIYKNFFDEYTLIVDQSHYNKYTENSLHGNKHLPIQIKKNIYKLNNKSELKLVIEYSLENSKFVENDIYFELEKEIDINEVFIKKEIIEFLSLLN